MEGVINAIFYDCLDKATRASDWGQAGVNVSMLPHVLMALRMLPQKEKLKQG